MTVREVFTLTGRGTFATGDWTGEPADGLGVEIVAGDAVSPSVVEACVSVRTADGKGALAVRVRDADLLAPGVVVRTPSEARTAQPVRGRAVPPFGAATKGAQRD